jgi:hypothetical protein
MELMKRKRLQVAQSEVEVVVSSASQLHDAVRAVVETTSIPNRLLGDYTICSPKVASDVQKEKLSEDQNQLALRTLRNGPKSDALVLNGLLWLFLLRVTLGSKR